MDLCLKRLEHQLQREGDFRSAQTNKFDYTYNESGIDFAVHLLHVSFARETNKPTGQ